MLVSVESRLQLLESLRLLDPWLTLLLIPGEEFLCRFWRSGLFFFRFDPVLLLLLDGAIGSAPI